jgi:hypothetical protein
LGLLIVAIAAVRVQAIPPLNTVQWVGPTSGQWNDPDVWRNLTTNTTGNASTLMNSRNGSNGMNNVNPATTAARHVVIGGGATVEYFWPTGNGAGDGPDDFRIRQGSTLTIKDGATWVQNASTYPENGWTRMDPSHLILDGGTFRRTGESMADPPDGGGLVIFGSFNDDSNFSNFAAPPKINVDIKNGGKIENTGQLWFGTDDESSPNLRVNFNINNGSLDLTGGGTATITNNVLPVAADLAFFFSYNQGASMPRNEEHIINFTGPGSITVDQAGIFVYREDEFGVWTGGTGPVSYEDLWTQGILRANGVTGSTPTPGNFSDFFTVTGTPGMENYRLMSLIEGPAVVGLTGDYNNNGVVDAADYVLWRDGGTLQNDPTPGVQPGDFDVWRMNFGKTAGPGAALSAAVPEPAAAALLLAGVLLPFSLRRARAVV